MTTTTTDTTTRIAELSADARKVYKVGGMVLIELADKYGVTTSSLTYARENPNPVFASLAAQAIGTKSTMGEMQRKLYATIKSQLREMGA